ncbi:MAG TPA: penicillin-binding protein 2 [Longimicrobiales bacterium]
MMDAFHLHARRRRARGAAAVLMLGLGGLGFVFFQTQVLKNTAYALRSEANRLRPLPIPAPRGTIFDRNGEIVADNVPGYALSLLPGPRDSLRSVLDRLAPLLGLGPDRIDELMQKSRAAPGRLLLVANDLTFEEVSALEERRALLPGLYIDMRPKRRYPAGDAVAHLVGYVGEISQAELEDPAFEAYEPGQLVGKAGLEREYEAILGGRPGVRYVEVDAYGRIVGPLGLRERRVAPVPGRDLHLYLDLELQRWIARIFPDSMRGAIVALEPGTGHVLALYSSPGYDPNEFVGGVAPDLWSSLNEDAAKPLLRRAVTGLYPPGSTFKLFTAAIGLELGVVDADAYMPIPCRGGMQYGNRYFRCWESAGHGFLDLPGAIQKSCNVYFYQLGLQIGLDRLLSEATRFGFSAPTGIDLPTEAAGQFPDGPEWYRERFGWRPTEAEVLNLAIGQGPNAQTPLKMAQLYAALAGDGLVRPPRIAATDVGDDEETRSLSISKRHLAVLRDGLRRVIGIDGTAHVASLEHWDLAGKTGTAENPHGEDHAWFVGMAGPKGGDPEIVVAALIEFGGHGWFAANYAAKAADYYLRRKHGIPVDTIQTLRDHLLAGRPVPWAEWR